MCVCVCVCIIILKWFRKKKFNFIYLSLSVLGLCCSILAFSNCDEWGPLSSCGAWVSHCYGFSCCRAQALGPADSIAGEQRGMCSLGFGGGLEQICSLPGLGMYPEACAVFLD